MKKNVLNKSQKEIPVFFSTDDNYVPCLVVSIQSLKDTASIKNNYAIYILNSGLKEENKRDIKELETSNIKIKFVDVSHKVKSIYAKLQSQVRDYYSPSIYYRLFIPSMFPQYKKVLYLDCDITIVDDVAKLYNHDLGNNLIGAIRDQVVSNSEIFSYYVKNASGVESEKYFNSGIIVMNLHEFRKYHFESKFLYLLNNFPLSSVCPDQDYLNILCKNRVLYIHKGWNMMPIADDSFDIKDLHLVHYNMYQKPWKYEGVLYEEYFWETAKRTKYYERLLKMRENYTQEMKDRDIAAGKKLLETAKASADDPNNFLRSFEKSLKEDKEDNLLKALQKFWGSVNSTDEEEVPVNA